MPPKGAPPASEPTSSASGEYVRRGDGEREPFRSQSTTRRALPPRTRTEQDEEAPPLAPLPGKKQKKQTEEQTLRSAKVPQRIRMSLRMRRVAADTPVESPEPLRADDRVGLRLAGRSIELPMAAEVIAGRSADCGLHLGDRLCSLEHAVFCRAADGGALVRDLRSTNGTYVNGVRIYAEHRLNRGDWITIGNETLELCILPSNAPATTPTIPVGRGRPPSDRSNPKTDPGSPLLTLASLAVTSANRTPPSAGAEAARKPLEALLRRIERGETISESEAEMGGRIVLHLSSSTSDPAWLDYLFRLYTARRCPLPAPLLDRLNEVLAQVPLCRTAVLNAYVGTLQRAPAATWSQAQQLLLTRLVELQQRCEHALSNDQPGSSGSGNSEPA
jgi:hypothetical protein